ncbi:MAG: hypothetical protein JXR95_01740 [Deltaproteobacteria bacterium]|nr:hypothetical protein [Deltaproteobacteria bacterium]
METYFCPHCEAVLNENDESGVVLKGRLNGSGFSVSFQVSVPSQLGVYGATFPDYIEIDRGVLVDFCCPHCNGDLSMEEAPNHASIKMRDSEDRWRFVSFNREYGKHSSFLFDVESHELIASYGEHQQQYKNDFNKPLNFFGV